MESGALPGLKTPLKKVKASAKVFRNRRRFP
jgi:hypothetical protein